MRRNKDFIIIAAVVLTIIAAYVILFAVRSGDEARVNIYIGSKLYDSVPFGTVKTVTVEQNDGKVNIIEITAVGVRMKSSTCPNKDCVMQGLVPFGSGGLLSEWIICLPNGVSVEIVQEER